MAEPGGRRDQDERNARALPTEEARVRFSVIVNVPADHAFRVFTERFDDWWPRDHHIGKAAMAVAVIERRVGGRWYELGVDGSECDWGVVLDWEPGRHLAISWHMDGEFRYDADRRNASRVDVWFEALDDRRTEVVLEHSGLDRHGETWRKLKERISRGWPGNLRRFADSLDASARHLSLDTNVSIR